MTTATLFSLLVFSSAPESPAAPASAPAPAEDFNAKAQRSKDARNETTSLGASAPLRQVPAPASAPDGGEPEASPAALMFGKKCSSCHSLGEGDRTGPDLVGVTKRRDTAWIKKFVRTPGAVIDSGDAAAKEMLDKFKGVRMPDQDLKDDELDAILAYLADCTAKGMCKIATGKAKHANEATPAEVAFGRALFEGSKRLTNGGPACISCHNVRGAGILGGGTLSKDLTHAYPRIGDPGLSSALESTPYPVMNQVFAKRALTSAEAFALKAYLADVSKDGTSPTADHNFLYLGIIGLFVALGAIGVGAAGRLRGVRQSIVKRGAP
ncbi:MAG: c-type cytochrome [Deltaproteobacteria bacterium]|nr:c-type cytochrome [Deltaproteobacteria bacterium]